LAETQHGAATFPPVRTPRTSGGAAAGAARSGGHQLPNPTPQDNVLRALLRAWHEWAAAGTLPPPSQYPRLSDRMLVRSDAIQFPGASRTRRPRRSRSRIRELRVG
jgi:hypothetical protein